jgi:uncharacterized membrane protein (DUF4010 family)
VWRNLDGLVATAITQLLGHAPTPSDVTDIVEDMFAAWTHLTPAPDRQLVTAVLLIACQYHADRDFHVTTAIRYLATALDGLLALTARNRPQFACA